MSSLAVVIGRYQFLQAGHISLFEKASGLSSKVLILIGSHGKLPDFRNPLDSQVREKLIRDYLGPQDKYIIRHLKDRPTDNEWVSDVISHTLDFEEDPSKVTFVCGEKDGEFYKENFLSPVVTVDSSGISATKVREAWYSGTDMSNFEGIPQVTKDLLLGYDTEELRRLKTEYASVLCERALKNEGHPYSNPIEPVSFSVILRDGKVLLGKRGGSRGKGQWGLPGGYVQNTETTLDAALRETEEELGFSLGTLITEGNAHCLVQAVEENMDDLGVRTLGVNYLFVIHPDCSLDITVDGEETTEYTWVPLKDITSESFPLFYNHNLVVQRLVSKLGEANT